jgi:hypothetical protein
VRIKVIPKQDPLGLVCRIEEPRPAVMNEIRLVDGLEAELETLGRKR